MTIQFSGTPEMLLEFFFICHLGITLANPFHKYPYVFLLDIGNEELQATAEQIRVSIPGGSLALRYPAVGDGDTIAHVRVSGIDFGTDLKANIIDGGPGYKYVVIVFMGNPGAAYDAVVTINTLADEVTDGAVMENANDEVPDDESSDENNSAEADNDNEGSSIEETQSGSNFYDSAEDSNGESGKEDDNEDIYVRKEENTYGDSKGKDKSQDYEKPDQEEDNYEIPRAEKYSENSEYVADGEKEIGVDKNLYEKYNALKPHLYDNVKVYSQEANDYDENSVDNTEDQDEFDQMFNDEEVHSDNDSNDKNRDSNNNYVESDDNTAVAY